jgi:hypothetical protein
MQNKNKKQLKGIKTENEKKQIKKWCKIGKGR